MLFSAGERVGARRGAPAAALAVDRYLRAPIAAGFTLRAFLEPAPAGDELTMSRRFAKSLRIPYFIFMRWAKRT